MTGRILLVDRNLDRAIRIEGVLIEAAFDVTIAATESDALILCRRGVIDVVAIDGDEPEGPALCRRIRDDVTLNHILIVALSRIEAAQERLRARDAGIDACILLPISDGGFIQTFRDFSHFIEIKQNFARTALLAGFRDPREARSDPLPPKILLIDPNPTSRERLTGILEGGSEIVSIADEGRLRAHRKAAAFDLVICDPKVVGAAGIDFHAWLRTTDAFGCGAGLVLLADTEDDLAVGAALLDADAGLVRPIDRSDVLCTMPLMARKRSLVKDLRILEVRLELKTLLFRPNPLRIEESLLRRAA